MNIPATELKAILKKLSNVKTEFLTIESGFIHAKDEDVWVEVRASVFAEQLPFSILGRKFIQVANRFSGNLEIERQEFKLVLKSAKAKVEIEIQPCDSVKMPAPPKDYHQLPLEAVKNLLSVAAATTSKMKSPEYGDVVQFKTRDEIEGGIPATIQTIGFDSVVLTRASFEVERERHKQRGFFNTLINLSAIQLVQLMDAPTLAFGETETGVFFESEGIKIIAAKPAKKYPDYESYIPQNSPFQFNIPTADLAQSLKIVEPLEEGDGSIGLHFLDGVLQLFSVGASDEVQYEQINPDPVFQPVDFETRINYKHLLGITSRANESLLFAASGPEGILRFDSGNVTTLTASMWRKK